MVIKQIHGQRLVDILAKRLKEQHGNIIKPPKWAYFVKTGPHKERPPDDLPDKAYDGNPGWWYYRAASILRQVAIKGPIGVSRLRTRYGGIRAKGYHPGRFNKGYGKIIRTILQQLEKAELVKFVEVPRKGRTLTQKGLNFILEAAKEIKD